MAYSYIAYIDESGDDGLSKFRIPRASGGASCWLVISALVLRYSRDLECVRWRNEIMDGIPQKKSRDLHFLKLNHNQKVFAANQVSNRFVRACSIIAEKTTIPTGIYNEKNQLYFYLCRYLLERVSWLCRDYRYRVREGDGRVKIVFSRRGGMSYPDFQAYLVRLRNDPEVRIHWQVIDINGVEAFDHSRRAGLQLADVIASSFAAGVEPNQYGNCEPRYAEALKPITYNRRNNYFSYGVKAFPKFDALTLTEDQKRFVDLFR
jgi:hypothetical protein